MARKKTGNLIQVFKIFFNSIHTYFMYFDQTSKALLFPIFGQLISIIILFTIAYQVDQNMSLIQENIPLLKTDENLLIALILVLLPFFIIFFRAFYKYLIQFASLNLLFYTNSNKKKVKNIDFAANNNVIKRKFFQYIILCFIITILYIPPLIFILPFACLAFQIFALEGDISPMKAVKRSIEMVKSNIIPTLILIVLCALVTYWFLPTLFIWAAQKTSLYYMMLNSFEKFVENTPILASLSQIDLGILNDIIKDIFAPLSIARYMTEGIIAFIILGFTLPFRCCCFTELYRLYDSETIKENSKMTDEIVKRATSKK